MRARFEGGFEEIQDGRGAAGAAPGSGRRGEGLEPAPVEDAFGRVFVHLLLGEPQRENFSARIHVLPRRGRARAHRKRAARHRTTKMEPATSVARASATGRPVVACLMSFRNRRSPRCSACNSCSCYCRPTCSMVLDVCSSGRPQCHSCQPLSGHTLRSKSFLHAQIARLVDPFCGSLHDLLVVMAARPDWEDPKQLAFFCQRQHAYEFVQRHLSFCKVYYTFLHSR